MNRAEQLQLAEALLMGTSEAEALVAEAIADGRCHVINRHSVSPGGLRFLSAAELDSLQGDDADQDPAADGTWALGTGFVAVVSE